jgi:predicted GH43/DUF377 family glycosyl hydrolase
MRVHKLPVKIKPSSKRWLLRPFIPGDPKQVDHILSRILSYNKRKIQDLSQRVVHKYVDFHQDIVGVFLKHFENVQHKIDPELELDEPTKLVIGAYFSQFYALEATALCNPSIVPHPSLPSDEKKLNFVLSLRAVGEGHISSIVFREGYVDEKDNIVIQPPRPFIMEPYRKQERIYSKEYFLINLEELGVNNEISKMIFQMIPEEFTLETLEKVLDSWLNSVEKMDQMMIKETFRIIRNLALSNYDTYFEESQSMSERVIFPNSPSQTNGIEDARFIRFEDDDGSFRYIATFTAYNGKNVVPEILETKDFLHFKVSTLAGASAKNKGMAMFPKKINGKYKMLGRHDNESIYLTESDDLYTWPQSVLVAQPSYPWEFFQIGNCSSPMEIDEGWLVITHGVGAVRRYSIGALLLDKNQPEKVLGRLKRPLLEPSAKEAFGYVPNVLYSCGALIFNRKLILPYAVSDSHTKFAMISIDEILKEMV